ncbi:NADP-dependent betaine aldehyde dehydrogenase [Seminavis robusta]|uniref:NADP-dependent betaine aldehyde dehydrogenase n=1 Tax=Seminavis robusta TaxID=568900 RepID=A0A9N8H9C2_9STRA|nr:NADP-dependent betaine aldehyde dehydrogenase [Seminavis robusta]|eukprot:Sro113_g056070.1 NADP-dependent betaine aldehyde dehydrogenase (477) ;mRNA; f:60784-62367
MGQGVVIEKDNANGSNVIVNKNPATDEVISKVPCSSTAELDALLETAQTAQPAWALLDVAKRIQLLKDGMAELAKLHKEELPPLMTREMGKPLSEAQEEVDEALEKDEFLQLLQDSLQPKQHNSCLVVRQAVGVVVVLSPWNFPVDEILYLLLPALGSGNTAIVKPSEVTPETGAKVVSALASVLPPGVVQLAQGDGAVGAYLVSHPTVDMVCMTGSSATGKNILGSAAPSMKRFVLELGGKDPMVVLEDADLNKAAKDAATYSLSNTGQVCCSVERIYVAQSVYDPFCDLVTKYTRDNFKVGNGMDEGVNVGPLVSTMQRDIVAKQVDDAVQKGAKVLYKSPIPEEKPGSFYPVTVVADITKGMDIYTQETFGPVVALMPFDGTETEAIRLANDTEYGLSGAVYSQDVPKAQRIAAQIQAGQVGINCYALECMDVACPWVGFKSSGYNYHSGVEGFHNFSLPKSLVFVPPPEEED